MARNPLWAWSLRLYKRPGVAPACLTLQDRAGIDVNLLLFCLWAGSRRLALSGRATSDAVRISGRWSASVVQPLRAMRRRLKAPAQSSRSLQGFRRRVAALELESERLQQDVLVTLVRGVKSANAEPAMCAADNLALYFRQARIRLAPRDWTALRTVIRAAF